MTVESAPKFRSDETMYILQYPYNTKLWKRIWQLCKGKILAAALEEMKIKAPQLPVVLYWQLQTIQVPFTSYQDSVPIDFCPFG